MLGICFGAQLLARVLGGTVGRAPRSERGFTRLDSTDEAVLPAGEWLQFHDDAFTLPPGAELLAANAVGVQAFRHGPHLGVQFHPEITPAAFDAWVESWRAAGELDRVAAATDLPALKAEMGPAARPRAGLPRSRGPLRTPHRRRPERRSVISKPTTPHAFRGQGECGTTCACRGESISGRTGSRS